LNHPAHFNHCGVRLYDNRVRAQSATELTLQEKRGKQIYRKGEGDTNEEIKAILSTGNLKLPASSFPCANCHGLRGEGSKEGGLQPPPRPPAVPNRYVFYLLASFEDQAIPQELRKLEV
jgi:cytochrome c553